MVKRALQSRMGALTKEEVIPESMVASVVLGSPYKNCQGSGICRVSVPVAQIPDPRQSSPCQEVRAIIEVQTTCQVTFRFVRKWMCAGAERKYFSGSHFEVDSSCVFQPAHWLADRYIVIHPGAYPIERDEEHLIVKFW